MEKKFNKISISIPEGYYPQYCEMEGGFLNIYLTEKNPLKFDIIKMEGSYPTHHKE